ncbi:hypothetical protein CTAYLR_009757 [Chrysophaeum taylorii]|uniref:Radial spoke head protein 9 homolog n=1 Tax=Chrysophaeum taylorii TaxID=2483200 RepID=A0AAD7UAS2_9STRA|nr:hypothetical protein CTAYLR_009757 [Chrysophaeum taylorii]
MDCELLELTSCCLSVGERAGLEGAMLQVANAEGLKLRFWGRIFGDTADYLIAVSDEKKLNRKFYYTTSHKPEKLSQMAEAKEAEFAPFSGDPSTIQEDPEFREEHRLAFAVQKIDFDSNIAPAGAWLVDASRQVVPNASYQGLSHEAALNLKSYFHSREPRSSSAKNATTKMGLVRATEFLDPIADDMPKGVFALSLTPDATAVTLRSLYWPGAVFVHKINTRNYGSFYFGDGLPNSDLAFML